MSNVAPAYLIDVDCPYGQDISLVNGDFGLIADSADACPATLQQFEVLLQQASNDINPLTGAPSMPDDKNNPTLGAGIRKWVGRSVEVAQQGILRDALASVDAIPSIVSDSLTVSFPFSDPLVPQFSFTTNTGASGVLPDSTN